eukprot:65807-Prymnesium_polylepis.2
MRRACHAAPLRLAPRRGEIGRPRRSEHQARRRGPPAPHKVDRRREPLHRSKGLQTGCVPLAAVRLLGAFDESHSRREERPRRGLAVTAVGQSNVGSRPHSFDRDGADRPVGSVEPQFASHGRAQVGVLYASDQVDQRSTDASSLEVETKPRRRAPLVDLPSAQPAEARQTGGVHALVFRLVLEAAGERRIEGQQVVASQHAGAVGNAGKRPRNDLLLRAPHVAALEERVVRDVSEALLRTAELAAVREHEMPAQAHVLQRGERIDKHDARLSREKVG